MGDVAKFGMAGVNHHYSMLSASIGECPSGFKCGINYQPPMEEFGSTGVIGNPMGFARNVGFDIKNFLSVPAKGMAPGTTSFLSNTVYAMSDDATQGNSVKLHTRLAPLRLDLDEEMIVSFFDFIRTVISRLQSGALSCPDSILPIVYEDHSSSPTLPSVVLIGAPWQQVFLLARRQK
ncbi:hypothetical protein HHK36_001984 [Tetracentron sinense]|uniref:Uncharacterized protein n=1 Tax=Tetracentron sinense TaxID=13715 RepID=A0A835DS28_TETSI|nr:hypothetical protein HHK36_001984 [Tetracentron sinense]